MTRNTGRRFRRRRRILAPAALVVLAVLLTLILLPGFCGARQTEEQAPVGQTENSDPTGEPNAAREPSEPAPEPRGFLVPVAHLTSTVEGVTGDDLAQMEGLAVPERSSRTAGELLDRPGDELQSFRSAAEVVDHVSRTPDAVGLVPWQAVNPRVKALAFEGESLLEPDAGEPGDYPLAAEGEAGPDPEQLRRVVVGGDIVLDRGQNYAVIQQGLGIDFPLSGGYAAVTDRVAEESQYSEFGIIHQFTAQRQDEGGAVREYLNTADLTLANFENPVIRDAVWHPETTTFTGDLELLPIVQNAGIDGVTLGNNHVLDAGYAGLEETLGHLSDAGIKYAGAGPDLAAAREPMIFDVGGTSVGVLSYQGVPSYDWAWAAEGVPGTAPLVADVISEDIRRLRPEVDLLVVMPHWGNEYLATPEPEQVEFAHQMMDAGADLIVGHHAHWPKGIEMYKEKPIFYGVGNFLLDQSWSEETSTGILVEATLYEGRVVQTRPVPFIVLDYAQPNFLVPEAGGDRALETIFSTSLGPEFDAYKAVRE